jgi:ubiquinone/menaquinone biosynthesis C-methylase UbiE
MTMYNKKITKPHPTDVRNCIFTAQVNYFKTGEQSIWGEEDKETVELLETETIKGKWLHLGAGDGRYNLTLLKNAKSVTVTDIDEGALSKLWHNTPKKYKSKLTMEAFNLINVFPFEDNSFDGIFAIGIIHLFPKDIAQVIFKEINRVLKTKGKVIIDFVVDAKRTKLDDGTPYIIKKGADLSLSEGKQFLNEVFKDYKIRVIESEPNTYISKKNNPPYKLECTFLLIAAEKE